MSFRKRNTPVVADTSRHVARSINTPATSRVPGVRPSPIDGRLVTSTGTPSLDSLLAGHGGLALGSCLMIEENGTTDYSGALVKYFAAEGVVQGHEVRVLGLPDSWSRDLPGMVGEDDGGNRRDEASEKMKIAWRYEGLGHFGATSSAGRRGAPAIDRRLPTDTTSQVSNTTPFCHIFDLTKRLSHPNISKISYSVVSVDPNGSPFDRLMKNVSAALASSSPHTVHRLIVPTLLSPAIYPPNASHPPHLLGFIHTLRSLLRRYPTQLTVIITLPSFLYPRSTGLIRTLEHIVDGVIELTPFPHSTPGPVLATSGASTAQEERPQGLVAIHKLPIFNDRGGGGGSAGLKALGEDLAFVVSRKKFDIRPFSLPPADGDVGAQVPAAAGNIDTKAMEF